jgi:2',3'-cyclic-nucleotide 2'-phosphodiesterase (5'-nucleotidase family)
MYSATPTLLLDSGNFSDNPTPEGDLKTRGLLEGMSRLGYAVVNVGDRDLSMGYDEFRARTAGATFPFVSSNLVRQDTREPVFDPYRVVDAVSPDGSRKLRVGVIGATRYNPLFLKAGPEQSNLVIVKPVESVKRVIDEVREKSDVIVLLAALHKEEAKRIVRAVPEIDFVVGSYGGIITARDEKEGETWLLYSGNQGKRVGETRVYLDDAKSITSVVTNLYLLGARYPANQPMLEFVERTHAEIEELKRNAGGEAVAAPTAGQAASR